MCSNSTLNPYSRPSQGCPADQSILVPQSPTDLIPFPHLPHSSPRLRLVSHHQGTLIEPPPALWKVPNHLSSLAQSPDPYSPDFGIGRAPIMPPQVARPHNSRTARWIRKIFGPPFPLSKTTLEPTICDPHCTCFDGRSKSMKSIISLIAPPSIMLRPCDLDHKVP